MEEKIGKIQGSDTKANSATDGTENRIAKKSQTFADPMSTRNQCNAMRISASLVSAVGNLENQSRVNGDSKSQPHQQQVHTSRIDAKKGSVDSSSRRQPISNGTNQAMRRLNDCGDGDDEMSAQCSVVLMGAYRWCNKATIRISSLDCNVTLIPFDKSILPESISSSSIKEIW